MRKKNIIRWAGSKKKIIPILLENSPKVFNKYIEPFCGSARLFFELSPSKAILTDTNKELIAALNEIKQNEKIRDQLAEIPATKEQYYKTRDIDPEKLEKSEIAKRFLYLNRYCFNGIYRTNMSGKFNVPMGTKTGDFPSNKDFEVARKSLKNAKILHKDFLGTKKFIEKNDFIYIDPPYAPNKKFTGNYGLNSFNIENMKKLIDYLDFIDKKEAFFLLSYRACEDTISTLEKKYELQRINVKRHISGTKKNWQDDVEIIVKNYGKFS